MILKYKVYERLELRGIEPFNTLIGSFRYNEDAKKFLNEKQKGRCEIFSVNLDLL